MNKNLLLIAACAFVAGVSTANATCQLPSTMQTLEPISEINQKIMSKLKDLEKQANDIAKKLDLSESGIIPVSDSLSSSDRIQKRLRELSEKVPSELAKQIGLAIDENLKIIQGAIEKKNTQLKAQAPFDKIRSLADYAYCYWQEREVKLPGIIQWIKPQYNQIQKNLEEAKSKCCDQLKSEFEKEEQRFRDLTSQGPVQKQSFNVTELSKLSDVLNLLMQNTKDEQNPKLTEEKISLIKKRQEIRLLLQKNPEMVMPEEDIYDFWYQELNIQMKDVSGDIIPRKALSYLYINDKFEHPSVRIKSQDIEKQLRCRLSAKCNWLLERTPREETEEEFVASLKSLKPVKYIFQELTIEQFLQQVEDIMDAAKDLENIAIYSDQWMARDLENFGQLKAVMKKMK